MRHRPGGVGLTARVTTQECTQIGGNGLSGPFWGICVHCCAVGLGCGWPWDRNSVHKWEDRASRRRFGAFVYTVATRVTIRIATRAASGGMSASTTMACRLRLLAGLSHLAEKTDSERVAPLPRRIASQQRTQMPHSATGDSRKDALWGYHSHGKAHSACERSRRMRLSVRARAQNALLRESPVAECAFP